MVFDKEGETMKDLFNFATIYVRRCNWKDMALVKVCLCALGILLGLSIPKHNKKRSFIIAGIVFALSYVYLMLKFIKIIMQENQECKSFH
jgi:hypothetical protein